MKLNSKKMGVLFLFLREGLQCNFILKRSYLSFSPTGPQTIDGGESGRAQVYH
jgi:hypothetical protein